MISFFPGISVFLDKMPCLCYITVNYFLNTWENHKGLMKIYKGYKA